MELNPNLVERVTAATNIPLSVVSLLAVVFLWQRRGAMPLRAGLWLGVFGGLAIASELGLFAHGFTFDLVVRGRIWQFINAAFALSVACFAAGAVLDGWGAHATRRVLPGLLALGAGVFYYATFRTESFLPLIIYESVAMLFSLLVYATLAARKNVAGAAWMTAGVAITILAAMIQATRAITFTLGVPFDHNGVFHLVQVPGLFCLLIGVRRAFKIISPKLSPSSETLAGQTRTTLAS